MRLLHFLLIFNIVDPQRQQWEISITDESINTLAVVIITDNFYYVILELERTSFF